MCLSFNLFTTKMSENETAFFFMNSGKTISVIIPFPSFVYPSSAKATSCFLYLVEFNFLRKNEQSVRSLIVADPRKKTDRLLSSKFENTAFSWRCKLLLGASVGCRTKSGDTHFT